MKSTTPEIIAHRGYSKVAPENTLAAIEAALEAGATAIEVDLQTAIDGTPVLFHDVHLGRTSSGVGPIRRRTVGQLKSLDAGSWFSEAHAGERIPTLAEALERLDGRVQRFYPEVKGYREMEDLDRMLSIVRARGLLDRSTFLSLDRIVLGRLRQTEPSVAIGFVLDDAADYEEVLETAVRDGRAILDLDASLALEDPDLVAQARDAGVEVGAWTVNRPEDADRLWESGVTRFTTDDVSALLRWASSIGSPASES